MRVNFNFLGTVSAILILLGIFQNCGEGIHALESNGDEELINVTQVGPDGEFYSSKAGVVDPETGDITVGGDMIIGHIDDVDENGEIPLFSRQNNSEVQSSLAQNGALWGSLVPYEIDSSIQGDERRKVVEAIRHMNLALNAHKVNLKVVLRSTAVNYGHTNYLYFRRTSEDSCYAKNRGRGGNDSVYLGRNCFGTRTIVHEIMHVLGFIHEQQRNDRDSFVNIHFDNIKPAVKYAFEKVSSAYHSNYDSASIMQYDSYAFSKNLEKTITLKDGSEIHSTRFLSNGDIASLIKIYGVSSGININDLEEYIFSVKIPFFDFSARLSGSPPPQPFLVLRDKLFFHTNTSFCEVLGISENETNRLQDLVQERNLLLNSVKFLKFQTLVDKIFTGTSTACMVQAVNLYPGGRAPWGRSTPLRNPPAAQVQVDEENDPLRSVPCGMQYTSSSLHPNGSWNGVYMKDCSTMQACKVPDNKLSGVKAIDKLFNTLRADSTGGCNL